MTDKTNLSMVLNSESPADSETQRLLRAASHALRSYEHGNSATDSAKDMADAIDRFLRTGEPQTLIGKATASAGDPNASIEVLLTDAQEFHCFQLIFRAASEPGKERIPLELFLHTTQAIDLFSKLATQLAAYMQRASAELLEIKTRELKARSSKPGAVSCPS